jgi:putative Ca2+/H+ antiporter (TMEM165/GDT1 family)
MSWNLFVTTFAAIFLAELGDKTQIATFAMAGSASSRWVVFAAASLALVASSALAVLAGAAIGRYVPAIWIKRAAGALFIVLGFMFLLSRPEPPAAGSSPDTPAASDGAAPAAAGQP